MGFFHEWIEAFSRELEKVIVIAQYVGERNLPKNVELLSLGKEKGFSKIRQLFNYYRFLFQILPQVDAVFVHMIPAWVVFGGPVFGIFNKKVFLWYVHKKVNFILKLAEKFVAKIFTASARSFRLRSDKIIITGHGIDTEKFPVKLKARSGKCGILTAGRIAEVKNLHILIEAGKILKDKNFPFEIKIAGRPIMQEDEIYFAKLKNLIKEKGLDGEVVFVGAISNKNIAEFYAGGDLFVNFSDTGSIDKVVLEAMASGLLVLTSNEAFKDVLIPRYFTRKNPEEIAEKIIALSQAEPDPELRRYVVENHDLGNLVRKIANIIRKTSDEK